MQLLFWPEPAVEEIPQPELSDDFGTLAAIPGEEGELCQVGRLLDVEVAPLQQVHESRTKASPQALADLISCVAELRTGVREQPDILESVAPFYLDGTYPRPGNFDRDLDRLLTYLEALFGAGAKSVLITAAG